MWNAVAGDAARGLEWRREYLRLTYGQGKYADYEELVRASALNTGLGVGTAQELTARWAELQPWPGVVEALPALREHYQIGVVTNCSEVLGRAAAALAGEFDVLVTAERAGYYKPHPWPYQLAMAELCCAPDEVLFVAGSPSDLGGATGAGMDVVWHNQLGLAAPEDAPKPKIEVRDFPALMSWITALRH